MGECATYTTALMSEDRGSTVRPPQARNASGVCGVLGGEEGEGLCVWLCGGGLMGGEGGVDVGGGGGDDR